MFINRVHKPLDQRDSICDTQMASQFDTPVRRNRRPQSQGCHQGSVKASNTSAINRFSPRSDMFSGGRAAIVPPLARSDVFEIHLRQELMGNPPPVLRTRRSPPNRQKQYVVRPTRSAHSMALKNSPAGFRKPRPRSNRPHQCVSIGESDEESRLCVLG